MHKPINQVAFAIIFLVLTSCVPQPTPDEIQNADYGPKPENPQKIAEEWLKERIFEPRFSRFEHIDHIKKGWTTSSGKIFFGWIQCGTVNDDSRMNGYIYFDQQYYRVTIKNGQVISGQIDGPGDRAIRDRCKAMYDVRL